MARRWNSQEEIKYREELTFLYKTTNLSIKQIGKKLGLAEQTIFQRLRRLNIPTDPSRKQKFLNKRTDLRIPVGYSPDLAEFFGIMLGDGHISPTQTIVTLGTKEFSYVKYIQALMKKLFNVNPKIFKRKMGHHDIYLGSVDLVRWLSKEGLVSHKTKSQVDVPRWIFTDLEYQERFLRGFFDTDGSIYKLKFGIQIGLTNWSKPLLKSLHLMLITLGYKASRVVFPKIYVTRRGDVERFFREIKPANKKHAIRFSKFINAPVG